MNEKGRIFAVGDIHGFHDRLIVLMERLSLDQETDTLVFLGDYINRGPDSRKVIETLIELRAQCARTVFLMGNHEEMLLEYGIDGDIDRLRLLHNMGVEATLSSYGATIHDLQRLAFLPADHLEFLNALCMSWSSGPYLFVHADACPLSTGQEESRKVHTRTAEQLLASRRLAGEAPTGSDQLVIFGHTAFSTPLVRPDRIGIDTGAVYGNMLTALELPAMRFHHA